MSDIPDFDQIKTALEFDPFTPPAGQDDGSQSSPATTDTPVDQPSTEPSASPTSTEGTAPQPSPSAAPTPGGGEPSGEDLRRLIADQRALIESLQAQQKPQAPTQPSAEAAPQPVYTVDLPRELFQALGNEDENVRYKAMDGLVKGIMNTLAHDTQRYVKDQISKAVADVTGQIPQKVESVNSAAAIRQDFFSNFPALANPMLSEVVKGRIGQWIQAEATRSGGQFNWNADFRNRAGHALHQELGIPLPGSQAPAPAPAPAQPQPRRQSFASGGTTGAKPNGQDTNPFSDVLF